MIPVRRVATFLLLLCAATFAVGQAPASLHVPRTSSSIDLDGSLTEEAWKSAGVIDKFYETSPGDNAVPQVATAAYLMYDDRYFYIGIRADDPEPSRIRAPFVDRDGVIGTDDNIAIFLDTRNDKRSAIELRVNPRGIQADGIFNDANFSEDFSPDFYYDTAAAIGPAGWTAEFRIPFSSLRYSAGDPQTWNILVWRNYPREFRYAYHSAPIPRGSNCHICHAHPITGLIGLPKASDLIAAPYATAEHLAEPEGELGSELGDGDFDFDVGVDVKWTPSANHALDLTLNPDFSQVEADVAQITINRRFAVFYDEKRPFFLEGFDLYDTPMRAVYTRTITSPRYGVRATGKHGSTAYTVLSTQDRGGGLTIIPGATGSGFALQDFKSYATIGRVRHDIGSSFVGAVLTDRELDGGGYNRVFGPDGQWRPNESYSATAQLLFSDTKNPDRPDFPDEDGFSHAFTGSVERTKRTHDAFVSVTDIGDDFRADLGFMPQVGYRDLSASAGLRFYPANNIRFFRPSVGFTHQTDRDDRKIYQGLSIGVNGFGVKNTQFSAFYRPKEQIRVGKQLLEQTYTTLFIQTDPSRRIPRIGLDLRFGDSIDFGGRNVGDGMLIGLSATIRPHDRLDLQLNANREWLDINGSRLFTAGVQRIRAQYSFSNRSLVRVIAQYIENELGESTYDGSFLGSVLYSYKINWQTVLFVGYGDNRLLAEDKTLVETGRSVFLKVSYAFLR